MKKYLDILLKKMYIIVMMKKIKQKDDLKTHLTITIEKALIRALLVNSKKYDECPRPNEGSASFLIRQYVLRGLKSDGVDFEKINEEVYKIDRSVIKSKS